MFLINIFFIFISINLTQPLVKKLFKVFNLISIINQMKNHYVKKLITEL